MGNRITVFSQSPLSETEQTVIEWLNAYRDEGVNIQGVYLAVVGTQGRQPYTSSSFDCMDYADLNTVNGALRADLWEAYMTEREGQIIICDKKELRKAVEDALDGIVNEEDEE